MRKATVIQKNLLNTVPYLHLSCYSQNNFYSWVVFHSRIQSRFINCIWLLCFFIFFKSITVAREGNGTPLQYSCLENPMDGGAWWAAVHKVARSWTWLSDFTFTFHFHALEKEMATYSSVLAWRIPGTGAWWAAVYGVAQSRTRLKRLSSSSSSRTVAIKIWFTGLSC